MPGGGAAAVHRHVSRQSGYGVVRALGWHETRASVDAAAHSNPITTTIPQQASASRRTAISHLCHLEARRNGHALPGQHALGV